MQCLLITGFAFLSHVSLQSEMASIGTNKKTIIERGYAHCAHLEKEQLRGTCLSGDVDLQIEKLPKFNS